MLIVVVGLYVTWSIFVHPRATRTRQSATQARQLASFQMDEATRVVIDRPDTRLDFHLRGTQWQMDHPLSDRARQTAVVRLVDAIRVARIDRRFSPPIPWPRYGLGPQAVRVFILGSAADTLAMVAVGDLTPEHGNVYVRVNRSHEILLVPTVIRSYALAAVEDFRSRRVVMFDRSRVLEFSVHSPRGVLLWKRMGPRWITIDRGDTVCGNVVAVEAILRRLRGLRARRFYDEPATRMATDRSAYRVNITRRNSQTTLDLHVSFVGNGLAYTHVARESRVVEIDSTDVAPIFSASLLDLRDRRVAHIDVNALRRFTIAWNDTMITLVRDKGKWRYPNPAWRPPNKRRAIALQRVIRSLKYDSLATDNSTDSKFTTRPSLRLEFHDNRGTLLDEVWFVPRGTGADLRTRHITGTAWMAVSPVPRLRRLARALGESLP